MEFVYTLGGFLLLGAALFVLQDILRWRRSKKSSKEVVNIREKALRQYGVSTIGPLGGGTLHDNVGWIPCRIDSSPRSNDLLTCKISIGLKEVKFTMSKSLLLNYNKQPLTATNNHAFGFVKCSINQTTGDVAITNSIPSICLTHEEAEGAGLSHKAHFLLSHHFASIRKTYSAGAVGLIPCTLYYCWSNAGGHPRRIIKYYLGDKKTGGEVIDHNQLLNHNKYSVNKNYGGRYGFIKCYHHPNNSNFLTISHQPVDWSLLQRLGFQKLYPLFEEEAKAVENLRLEQALGGESVRPSTEQPPPNIDVSIGFGGIAQHVAKPSVEIPPPKCDAVGAECPRCNYPKIECQHCKQKTCNCGHYCRHTGDIEHLKDQVCMVQCIIDDTDSGHNRFFTLQKYGHPVTGSLHVGYFWDAFKSKLSPDQHGSMQGYVQCTFRGWLAGEAIIDVAGYMGVIVPKSALYRIPEKDIPKVVCTTNYGNRFEMRDDAKQVIDNLTASLYDLNSHGKKQFFSSQKLTNQKAQWKVMDERLPIGAVLFQTIGGKMEAIHTVSLLGKILGTGDVLTVDFGDVFIIYGDCKDTIKNMFLPTPNYPEPIRRTTVTLTPMTESVKGSHCSTAGIKRVWESLVKGRSEDTFSVSFNCPKCGNEIHLADKEKGDLINYATNIKCPNPTCGCSLYHATARNGNEKNWSPIKFSSNDIAWTSKHGFKMV